MNAVKMYILTVLACICAFFGSIFIYTYFLSKYDHKSISSFDDITVQKRQDDDNFKIFVKTKNFKVEELKI